MNFTVLISIYNKEKPEYFDRSLESIWFDQTVKPSEIILVVDGLLDERLYGIINKWKSELGSVLKIIHLNENRGLGYALNIGLNECTNDIVARMDTDDVAVPTRFEEQLKVLNDSDIGICGSWVGEFLENENEVISYRKVPEEHNDIIKYAKFRCPVNHPTVMYKKKLVQSVGGYQPMPSFEDYYLWVRMLEKGVIFYNISKPLVKMRIGNGMLDRRRGVKYIRSELNFLNLLRKKGFLTVDEYVLNILVRFPARVFPRFFLQFLYKYFLRTNK